MEEAQNWLAEGSPEREIGLVALAGAAIGRAMRAGEDSGLDLAPETCQVLLALALAQTGIAWGGSTAVEIGRLLRLDFYDAMWRLEDLETMGLVARAYGDDRDPSPDDDWNPTDEAMALVSEIAAVAGRAMDWPPRGDAATRH